MLSGITIAIVIIITIITVVIVLPGEVEDDDVNLFRFPVDSVNIRLEDLLKLDSRVHLKMHSAPFNGIVISENMEINFETLKWSYTHIFKGVFSPITTLKTHNSAKMGLVI